MHFPGLSCHAFDMFQINSYVINQTLNIHNFAAQQRSSKKNLAGYSEYVDF